jgi:hypothetical protein
MVQYPAVGGRHGKEFLMFIIYDNELKKNMFEKSFNTKEEALKHIQRWVFTMMNEMYDLSMFSEASQISEKILKIRFGYIIKSLN